MKVWLQKRLGWLPFSLECPRARAKRLADEESKAQRAPEGFGQDHIAFLPIPLPQLSAHQRKNLSILLTRFELDPKFQGQPGRGSHF